MKIKTRLLKVRNKLTPICCSLTASVEFLLRTWRFSPDYNVCRLWRLKLVSIADKVIILIKNRFTMMYRTDAFGIPKKY